MNIEDRKTGKKTFSVPENYFEDFHRNIMLHVQKTQLLPYCKKSNVKAMATSFTKWQYAAAVVLMFIIGGTAYLSTISQNSDIAANEYSNEYIDDMLESYPIDDYTFYCYLTNNDTDF